MEKMSWRRFIDRDRGPVESHMVWEVFMAVWLIIIRRVGMSLVRRASFIRVVFWGEVRYSFFDTRLAVIRRAKRAVEEVLKRVGGEINIENLAGLNCNGG